MRSFFHCTKFKIILAAIAVLCLVTLIFGTIASVSAPQNSFLGSVFKPIQQFAASVSDGAAEFFENFAAADRLREENKELKEELAQKNKDLIEYENAVRENDFLKDFLGIKEKNRSYEMQSAAVIARDPADP